ncbi:hypothetical protein MPSEU_000575300 [Mayamaea pseudoterrestris]|nr:hypothetical protein MPSEU_000575300 [Mayamaea pseudoterrestris]
MDDMNSEKVEAIPDKEIDASTNLYFWLSTVLCTFGSVPYRTKIYFGREEVTKTDDDLCGTHTSKRPYAELGSVDRGNCLCCVSVESALGAISPGCGCDERRVDEIVLELKHRMRQRGDAAQVRMAEATLDRLEQVDAKLDAILERLAIHVPLSMSMEDRPEYENKLQPME